MVVRNLVTIFCLLKGHSKEDNKQEKLQTRREFFRNAAKAVLPIIGAAALSSGIVKAADKIPMGCEHTCSGACRDNCHYACVDTCRGG